MSAVQLVDGFRRQRFSPVEAWEAVEARIDEKEPDLNAFCFRDRDAGRTAARESEARWQSGEPLGLLDGVPVSAKDLLYAEGWPTRHGSRATSADQMSEFDSPAVARLREGGAVLIGKTTTPEFGHKGVTESLLTGVTRNPWDTGTTCGGSSGGAAAALASGMGPLAVGTDGGGSCRKPANYCGVVGMKPSFGGVPGWPPSALWPLSSAGPMARSAADVAVLHAVMAAPDARDPHSAREAATFEEYPESTLAGLRVAFTASLGGANARPEIEAVTRASLAHFEELGTEITQQAPPLEEPGPLYRTLLDSGWASLAATFDAAQQELFDPGFAEAVERGRSISGPDVKAALDTRLRMAAEMTEFHKYYDVLVTPTNPTTAYPVGRRDPEPQEGDTWWATVCFTAPFNITGQPAISVPCGFSSAGLPVGIQIVGPVGGDALVLRVAQAFETVSNLAGQIAPD